jgi:hypothetical protein
VAAANGALELSGHGRAGRRGGRVGARRSEVPRRREVARTADGRSHEEEERGASEVICYSIWNFFIFLTLFNLKF